MNDLDLNHTIPSEASVVTPPPKPVITKLALPNQTEHESPVPRPSTLKRPSMKPVIRKQPISAKRRSSRNLHDNFIDLNPNYEKQKQERLLKFR